MHTKQNLFLYFCLFWDNAYRAEQRQQLHKRTIKHYRKFPNSLRDVKKNYSSNDIQCTNLNLLYHEKKKKLCAHIFFQISESTCENAHLITSIFKITNTFMPNYFKSITICLIFFKYISVSSKKLSSMI